MQEMVVEDTDVESEAAVSQFDMTVVDSEDGDLHSSSSVSPRHRLLGDSDTESLADGVHSHSREQCGNKRSVLFLFLGFCEARSGTPRGWPWTKHCRRTRSAALGDGSCSSCFPGCCCTGEDKVATFQKACWCNGLTIFVQVSGPNC